MVTTTHILEETQYKLMVITTHILDETQYKLMVTKAVVNIKLRIK